MIVAAEKLRRCLFWILDMLKSSPVANHLKEIDSTIKGYPDTRQIVENKLAVMLQHAAVTTDFYSSFKSGSIIDFPVINKTIIRDNETAFISTKFNKASLHKVVTSGSTGTPFCVYHNAAKKLRNTADTIYFAKQAGFELGQKLYYFKIWNDINKKNWFNTWSQNIEACNVFELSDTAIEQLLIRLNKDQSTIGLLAYASAFDAICKFLDRHPQVQIKSRVQSAIAMSEALNNYTKEAMQRHFKCVCISRYSNVENGMIAQQSIEGGGIFFINFASYYVEVLNMDDNQPCPMGQPGRIVVTDLYNEAMPMLRYDTGDIGILNEHLVNGKPTPVLEKIEGRKMDMVFNTNGHLVSSFTITNGMWKYTELTQYQFIQTSKTSYLFKLNSDTPFTRATELITDFKDIFGLNALIEIEYVDEIPLLNSGKRKKVMNIYSTSG